MESLSIGHWLILVVMIAMTASPVLGIVRGVTNGSVGHAVASALLPLYGLIYFFAGKRVANHPVKN